MPRFDPALSRSVWVFGAFLALLAAGLFVLFNATSYGERNDFNLASAGLFLATALAVWLGRPGAPAILDAIVAPVRRHGARAVAAFVLLTFAALLLVARFVLDGFPNSGDEIASVLQAQTYSQGDLWVAPPPAAEAFRQFYFLDVGGKWMSTYPPGWAMVLAPAAALGLPLWIVNPFIGAALLAAFFVLARRYVSRESAWIGVLFLGLSSFVVLNLGSYFSHGIAALYGVVFALLGLRYLAKGETWAAILAGACIGLMGLTRTYNAVIFSAPFLVALALTPGRRIGFFWFLLGGAPFLAALLAFNSAMTGHLLTPVQNVVKSEPFGAPTLGSVRLSLERLARLYMWTSPVLAAGFFAALAVVVRRGKADFADWIMPATIVLFLFYGGAGGNQYGPRYYFEAWPFAVLTILKAVDPILFKAPRGALSAWVSSAAIASLAFSIAYFFPRLEREHRVVMERQDAYALAEKAKLDNAIVIVSTPVGVIRPMAPRDLVRNGLRVVDRRIIYARDLGPRNAELRARFPGRAVYVYANGRLTPAP